MGAVYIEFKMISNLGTNCEILSNHFLAELSGGSHVVLFPFESFEEMKYCFQPDKLLMTFIEGENSINTIEYYKQAKQFGCEVSGQFYTPYQLYQPTAEEIKRVWGDKWDLLI